MKYRRRRLTGEGPQLTLTLWERAGLTGAEAILTGVAGIRPQPDGSLRVDPQPVAAGTIELHGLIYRDHTIDVVIAPDHTEITVDGRSMNPGLVVPARVSSPGSAETP